MSRLLTLFSVLLLWQLCFAQQPGTANRSDVPASCPVTKPSDHPFIPPPPYTAKASATTFWFGTDELWTDLPISGMWRGLPHYSPNDPRFRQKMAWWRVGYNWRAEPNPALKITGRRLDGLAAPVVADVNNAFWDHQSAMMSGLFIPTVGCWEITGRYHDEVMLSFVIWVAQ
jgi:hypothetical protein